jgi:hypothetical protein
LNPEIINGEIKKMIMKKLQTKYYLGLDIGIGSVG